MKIAAGPLSVPGNASLRKGAGESMNDALTGKLKATGATALSL